MIDSVYIGDVEITIITRDTLSINVRKDKYIYKSDKWSFNDEAITDLVTSKKNCVCASTGKECETKYTVIYNPYNDTYHVFLHYMKWCWQASKIIFVCHSERTVIADRLPNRINKIEKENCKLKNMIKKIARKKCGRIRY
jgi:hypothetical protein